MQKIRILLGVVTTLASLAACSNPPANPGNDGGTTPTDSGSATDTGHSTVDSATDSGSSSSGGTCAMPIDINAMGTAPATGTGRTIVGNNTTAPAAVMTTVADGSCASDGGGGTNTANEVVFQYTMQSGGYLSVSTDDPATTAMLDTIVWVLDACAAAGNELACNDDVDTAGGIYTSTAVSTGTVSSGTTVFIVVAGYGPGTPHTGAFTLNVRELQPHMAGQACDQTNPFCVDGYTCVLSSATATSGTCNANGTEYAPCNTTAPFCTAAGTQCSVAAPTADANGTCQMPVANAAACTPGFHDLCVPMNSCQFDAGSMTDGHCLADGSDNGACRSAAPFCDATLACSSAMPMDGDGSVCQMPIATGGVCTPDHFVCVANSTCIPDTGSTTMGHCLADGSMGGACRMTDPMCDGTLTCSPDTGVCG